MNEEIRDLRRPIILSVTSYWKVCNATLTQKIDLGFFDWVDVLKDKRLDQINEPSL